MNPTAVSLALPRGSDAPRLARDFAQAAIRDWGAEPLATSIQLAVSELVTNAVVHGDGLIRLKLIQRPPELIVEVYDGGRGKPALGPDAPASDGGRGLRIVEAVSARWGVEVNEDGKVVWCVITG